MSEENLTTLVVAVVGLFGALIQKLRSGRNERDHIEQDLRILAALPPESKYAGPLLESVESRIAAYTARSEARRDALGLSLAIAFLALGGYLIFRGFAGDGWWRLAILPGVALMLLGATGWSQDGVKRVRDARGRPIKT